MVDVAGEDDHRGRGLAAPPRGHFLQEVAQVRERLAEGGPVVEVDLAPQLLTGPGDGPAPGTVAEPLVPGLEPVEGGGEEPGDGGRDEQVVEVAARAVDDPLPLFVVADRPPVPLEDRPGPGVDEDRPGAAEVAAEAPAGARPGRMDPVRPFEQDLLGRFAAADALVEVVLGERARREVPEVLVDPVAGDAAHGAP